MFPLFRSHYFTPHVPLRVSSTQIASQAADPACDRFFFCVFGDAVWRDLSAANDDLTQCSGLLPARVSSVLKCAIAKLSKSSGGMPCVESLAKCVYLAGSTWRHSTVAMASISMRNGLMREIEVVDEGFKGLRVL